MHRQIEELEEAIANIATERAAMLCEALLSEGIPVERILAAISSAMEAAGRRYQEGEYFLPELLASGVLVEDVL